MSETHGALLDNPHILLPDWPAPARVKSLVTLRSGGCSQPPFASMNLGDHVGDNPAAVLANRQRLAAWSGLSAQRLQWLQQVHGVQVLEANPEAGVQTADAVTTQQPGIGCIVMTADCLPVLFCDQAGSRVAAAHAGWRGLADGVLQATLGCFADPTQVLAWLGPAIGPAHFEVGEDVRQRFLQQQPAATSAFLPSPERSGHWYADLYQLARLVLAAQGVTQVFGGGYCTYAEAERFFSYRRDGQTGRMASMIWLQS